MKQNIFKLLSCSLILLFALSCKKEKKGLRVLDGFPSGKFDFVWVWNQNGVPDTVTGEVSGPYPAGGGTITFEDSWFLVKMNLISNYLEMVQHFIDFVLNYPVFTMQVSHLMI
jgi:hypothetical protein